MRRNSHCVQATLQHGHTSVISESHTIGQSATGEDRELSVPGDRDKELDEIARSLHDVENVLRAIDGKPPEPYAPKPPEFPYCSFCGKGRSEVAVLVEGPSVFICDECVEKAQAIVDDALASTAGIKQ